MDIETFKKAAEYAYKNPTARTSVEFNKRMDAGRYDDHLMSLGVDVGLRKPDKSKRTFMEKVADFTGGKELGQGLGQALANPFIAKQQEQLLNDSINQQADLIKKRREIKDAGGDTTGVDKAIEIITQNINRTALGTEQLLNQASLTPKQVVGDALQLATTVGSFGTYGGATSGMASGTLGKATPTALSGIKQATSFGRGAIQGLKTGAATGGAIGTSTGAAQALQDEKTTGEIIGSAIKGGVGGAVIGGTLGAVTGGITGAIRGRKIVPEEKILESVTPNTRNISSKQYEKLLAQGRITPKTATKGSQYVLSEAEKQTALKYQNLLKSKDPVKNIANVYKEIAKQDDEVGKFLQKNNRIYNTGELKNSIRASLKDITDISIPEKTINANKEKLITNFVKTLKKNDMESLWMARKQFDRNIEQAFSGSPTLQNTMKREFRNAVQDFIATKTPEGVYKTSMAEMSNLFKLQQLLNRKAVSEKGVSALRLWMRRNPLQTKIIGIGAPALVGGAVFLD